MENNNDIIKDLNDKLKTANDTVQALTKKNDLLMMAIGELEATNNNLVLATWRERDLKAKLKSALDEVDRSRVLIEEQNKRITESINYARKIQNSIIPKQAVLQDIFNDSFMIYRPKDVVSGDFPFIVGKDDFIYFAAVDCTGHGVPGALLSVIGSLILNEIITYETLTPAKMLDKLHSMVVKTLRQGQEGGENERDGMDVGLCRINLGTGELMYSGAHRPLYIVRQNQNENEDLEELKGDKFPIGGVQYRGRGLFINYETTLKRGDKVFVCSDGYPDQFGGPDLNEPKKIGPKKTRSILIENKDKPMNQIQEALVSHFDEWKVEHKQMDDVLFIGIRY